MLTRRSLALVQRYAPEREKRGRTPLKTTTDSWRVDETSLKVKGVWTSLSRAVAWQGKTLEFRLSPPRHAEAAKRFCSKTLAASHPVAPRVSTGDKNAASPKALKELPAGEDRADACELRQSTSLHTLVEHDQRFITRRVKPGLGFCSFETAWRTFQGYQVLNRICKGPFQGGEKGDLLVQIAFITPSSEELLKSQKKERFRLLIFSKNYWQQSRERGPPLKDTRYLK